MVSHRNARGLGRGRSLHGNPLRRDPAQMSVFTIPAGVPFVDALAAGVVSKFAPEPGDLANIQILLPTRRACRALAEAFLRLGGGKPVLLPRMTPLGDVDEDELALSGLDAPLDIPLDIPLAISGLRRQLMLTRLVLAFSGGGATPDQASRLATELARLLDQIHTERLSFEGLEKLVPDKFSDHWRVTLKFLDILTKQWPKALAEEGCIDPAERRNRLLEAQTKAWLETPPSHPVIAAGSTGSIPATAGLLQTVARLPRGALVLPGLDLEMDDESWAVLEPSHPQFGMARLLKHMDVERTAVGGWPISANAKNNPERVRMLSLALKPAKTAGDSADAEIKPGGVSGMIRIDCPTPSEEAGVIALVMRETLETPGRTCALVTPDRSLARRVAVELRRWDIGIDDSAGRPLAETPTGAFLRLTAQLATEMSPITLLSVLKHPLAAGGWKSTDFRAWARRLETLLLRGPRPDSGIAGLRAALAARRKEALQRGHDKTVEALEALRPGLDILDEAFKPFMNLDAVLPGDFLRAHIAFAETLAATDAAAGAERLWGGEDGEAAALFIAELGENIDILEDPMEGRRYPALFDSLMAGRVVRPAYGRHARLHIWGNLEARLQHADVMVL
ncbi:MAG TPA: double-strand break repair protein AddB, partial [Rhodospirillales bacterium]|nr:double-strand break repair protein AddB [Rhodospirillales bacterium]